jgi:YD repeat-containing protein
VTQFTSPTGGVTDYTYDAQTNLWTVTSPANNDTGTRPVTTYLYDSLGRVTSVSNALGKATTYTYDALERVSTVTLPKPTTGSSLTFTTTYTYDNFDAPSGLVFTHVTDPNNVLTKQGYDQYEQLVRTVDALSNTTEYIYTKGLLSSMRDANNNVTTYGYDNADRLSYVGFPDGTSESYLYYADNSLFQKTDRKSLFTSYVYDAFKRVAQFDPWGVVNTYDGQKLTQVVDSEYFSPTDTQIFGYDSSYRLSSVTQGNRGTITYQFNSDDSVASYSVQTGPSATYGYYPDGSVSTIVWSLATGNFKYRHTLAGQYESRSAP